MFHSLLVHYLFGCHGSSDFVVVVFLSCDFVLFPFLIISDDQSQKLRKEENLGNILL